LDTENAIRRIHDLVTRRADAFTDADAIRAHLVMPFLMGLGHDPFDPDQVAAGFRRGQTKIDFATLDEAAEPHMLVCVLSTPENLEAPRAQLLASLLSEAGDVGLLTNGRAYRFHALDANRQMVEEPFLSFDLSEETVDAAILQPLTRAGYDLEGAIAAGRLTKLPLVAFDALLEQLEEGSELQTMFAARIVPGGEATPRSTAAVAEAFARVLRVLRGEEPALAPEPEPAQEEQDGDGRAMTGDEERAFEIVREICARYIDPARVVARPAQAYTAVLLDDNNRRSVVRLYFSAASTRYVGTFVGRSEKKNRIPSFAETANYAAEIEARLRELDPGAMAKYDEARAAGREVEPTSAADVASHDDASSDVVVDDTASTGAQPEPREGDETTAETSGGDRRVEDGGEADDRQRDADGPGGDAFTGDMLGADDREQG
jgi:hypothetical protein